MDTNQVGSINFDANALYLEEDSEHEDDKQQDNELQALISQGGLDGLDDSLLSSSGDSSCDGSENSDDQAAHHPHHTQHKNMPINGDGNMASPNGDIPRMTEPGSDQNMNDNGNENEIQDESLFGHNLDQTAASNGNHGMAGNNALRNQYSTPAPNQNQPLPQNLQATAIPIIKEDLYYRQRNANNNNNVINENESMPNFQQPTGLIPNQYGGKPVYLDQHEQTIAMEQPAASIPNDVTNYNEHYNQNYAQQLQQQHFVPHSKLHSLDRFAVPSSIMPPPAPQIHNHHDHLTNDHELSLNETDNEEEHVANHRTFNPTNPNLEPQTPNNFPLAAYTNGGVQLEFTEPNNEKNAPKKKIQTYEETSIIDLNELDEAQLKQLQAEEEQQQQEYFNIDHLNRLYCQAQFLYKIRGKKLEEVTNRFTSYQEDMSREIRAMKHRVYLAEKEKETVQSSLDQAHSLCTQYKSESDNANRMSNEAQDKAEKLKQSNRMLEQKLAENEEEIENLQVQIGEQQKLDTLERVQEQHEHFTQQLRDKYEKEIMQMRESFGEIQNQLKDKHDVIRMLTLQLETAGQNAEIAAVERADTVNRLTKNINELQQKYDQNVLIAGFNKMNVNSNESDSEKKIEMLSDKCHALEEQVRHYETLKINNSLSNQTNDDFHLTRLSNTQIDSNDTMANTLQRELERALVSIKQKRNEAVTYQNEIEKLKQELTMTKANLSQNLDADNNETNTKSFELEKLNHLVEELQREKIDLNNDLLERNSKLDEMMEQEEQFQRLKNDLELEIYSKQQHINECEKMIDNLHKSNQETLASINQQQNNKQLMNEYDAQIAELKLKVTNREHELQKTREMYIEVCNDKNNLQDTLKVQYDEEYEKKMKTKVSMAVESELDQQNKLLNERWDREKSEIVNEQSRQIDVVRKELKEIQNQLALKQQEMGQIQVEKSNLEEEIRQKDLILGQLKIKCSDLESNIAEVNRSHQAELDLKINEIEAQKSSMEAKLTSERTEMNTHISSLEQTINKLESDINSEKLELSKKVNLLVDEKEKLGLEFMEINQKFQAANSQIIVYETKMKEAEHSKNNQFESQLQETKKKLTQSQLELNEKSSQLTQREATLKDIMVELQTAENEVTNIKKELNETHKTELANLENISKMNEKQMLERQEEELKSKEKEYNSRLSQLTKDLETKLEESMKSCAELSARNEQSKLIWTKEKTKMDEAFQKNFEQLEKRFENDYSTFMQTHKESIQRNLAEKSQEHLKEKEKLIEMYERKLSDNNTTEMNLKHQIKELELKKKQSDNYMQTSPMRSTRLETPDKLALQNENTYIEKIASLEEIIGNADAHFEQEIDKQRQELEEDYKARLKFELENEEANRQQLIHIIENLKSQLKLDSNDFNSILTEHNVSDYDFPGHTTENRYRQQCYKLKQELEDKEKEMESVDEAYRNKLTKLQDNYDANLKQMESKYHADVSRIKQELSDNYKQAMSKTKNEYERLQTVIQKLKKTNSDSDRVIVSLKLEMNKMKEGHLNELTNLKMTSERDKESLKEKCDQYLQRISSLDKKLAEYDERLKEHCDMLKANLKQEHNTEMNKMQIKMKEMAKSHANTVELLKKQQQHNSKASNVHQINKTCQTETTTKDIEILETFRQQYLETLKIMKSEMMKQFDAQTQRAADKVSRQINEDRTIIQEKIQGVIIPRIIEILRQHRIAERLIETKVNELEKELIEITALKTPKSATVSNSSSISSSSSASINKVHRSTNKLSLLNTEEELTKACRTPEPQSVSRSSSNQNLKVKNLSPHKSNDQDKMPMYSKSASSFRDIQISQYAQENESKPSNSPAASLSTGYKYTPLRQSCSNLSQMNQLSPYSMNSFTPSSNIYEQNNSRKLGDTLQEESDRESHICKSPTRGKIFSRPLTADSINGARGSHVDKQQRLPSSMASSDSLYSTYSAENKKNMEKFDSDVCFDETNDHDGDDLGDSSNDLKTNFYKKYQRTQNIRQKKSQRHIPAQDIRPHSASNLRSSNYKVNNLSSMSNSNMMASNPIGELYEMSKNYKPIENLEQNKGTSSSAYSSTTSSSSSRVSSTNRRYDDECQDKPDSFSHYQTTNLKRYDSASDYDLESEPPIKLDSDRASSRPVLRIATSVTNGSSNNSIARLSSTTTNNLTNVTQAAAFTHNSLPRSRSRSRSQTPTDLITSHAYRNGTVASSRKTCSQNSDSYGINSPRVKTLASSSSSQYKTIGSSLGAAASLAKSQLMQKKKAFY